MPTVRRSQGTLSPLMRNIISRGTAVLVACWLGWLCVRGINKIERVSEERNQTAPKTSGGIENRDGPGLDLFLVIITGVPAAILFFFAVVPTRVLHAINPSHSTTEADDIAKAALEAMRP